MGELVNDDDEIEGGVYGFNDPLKIGAAKAEIEQKRSELIDALRESNMFSATILESKDNTVIHSSMLIGIQDSMEGAPESFLVYCALKVIKDLANMLETDIETTIRMLTQLYRQGVGKEWM